MQLSEFIELEVVRIIIAGIVGGFANSILSHDYKIVFPVFYVDLFIGGITAFVFWSLSSVTSTEPAMYGVAVLCGLAGTTLLKRLLDSQFGNLNKNAQAATAERNEYASLVTELMDEAHQSQSEGNMPSTLQKQNGDITQGVSENEIQKSTPTT